MIFLGFLIPLAIYLLILAYLNRSEHPVPVPGPWDCAGLLLASSGFLLLGGPAVLTGLYEEWRLAWLLGQARFLRGLGDSWQFWVAVWIGYFILVVSGAVWLVASRRCLTSIYNIEPAVLDEALSQALDRLGLEWTRAGPDRIVIRAREPVLEDEPLHTDRREEYAERAVEGRARRGSGDPATAQVSPGDSITLSLVPFVALHHVTLHWSGPWQAVRSEVETELSRAFQNIYTKGNPASRWFMSLAVSLFLVCFFALVGLVAIRFIRLLH